MFSTPIYIRPVSPKSLKGLQEIAISTFAESFGKENTPENMDAYLLSTFNLRMIGKELENPDSLFFFAETDQGTVGYLKVNVKNAQTEQVLENALEIERIYVLADYHGLGFGKKLFEQALETAKSQGCEWLWLGVWDQNQHAIGFYERMGFVQFDEHDFYLGDEKQRDVLMKLEI